MRDAPSTDPSEFPSNPPVAQPTISPTMCYDLIPAASDIGRWYDDGGVRHDCDFYARQENLCATQGSNHFNFGMNANTACCVCGGGSSWIPTSCPSTNPTKLPIIEPTTSPSTDPSKIPTQSAPSTRPSKSPTSVPTANDPSVVNHLYFKQPTKVL